MVVIECLIILYNILSDIPLLANLTYENKHNSRKMREH